MGCIFSFFGVFGCLFSILGLVFSIIGLVKSKELENGKGFGIAGIVISVVAFFVHGVIMAFMIRLFAAIFFLLVLIICL